MRACTTTLARARCSATPRPIPATIPSPRRPCPRGRSRRSSDDGTLRRIGVTIEQMQDVVGHRFPGGTYTIEYWENVLMSDVTGSRRSRTGSRIRPTCSTRRSPASAYGWRTSSSSATPSRTRRCGRAIPLGPARAVTGRHDLPHVGRIPGCRAQGGPARRPDGHRHLRDRAARRVGDARGDDDGSWIFLRSAD